MQAPPLAAASRDVIRPARAPRVRTADEAAPGRAGSVGARGPALSGQTGAGPARLRKNGVGRK